MSRSERRQRTKLVAVRFTPDEYEELAQRAAKCRRSIGWLIRNALWLDASSPVCTLDEAPQQEPAK